MTPKANSSCEIREVSAAETHALRGQVLRPGQPPEALVYPGDDVDGAYHLAAFLEMQLVGIASFAPEARPEGPARCAYRLRGMATLPEVRGHGFGAQLLRAGLARARQEGGDWVWCNARENAIGFYEHFGFAPVGAVFEISGIGPHRVMERTISG